VRAAVFESASRRVAVQELPDPEPGPGEVRVRVQACGICLSDVHLIDGTLPTALERVTPGHEPAGVIDRLGDGVPELWAVGTRVLMAAGKPCGRCLNCLRG
jgi:D-arabinose 1-dehydrogenase-like Zn-dependent alcohol dehydrogenase